MITAGARSWIFYVSLNVLIVALVWVAADRMGLLWIVPIMLSINLLVLTYGQLLDFSKLEGEEIAGHDRWSLHKIVKAASYKLQIPTPRVFLIPTQTPQALSFARSARHARIYVSEGLLERLTDDESAAILVQQMVALKMQAGVSFYFLGAWTDLLLRAGRAIDLSVSYLIGWKPQISVWPLTPVIWILQRLFIPKDIYLAMDRETAELLQSPEPLARALWKLESYAKTKPMPQSHLVWSHMCAVSPLREKRPWSWLKTQPHMKSRIKSLVGYYPL